MSLNFYVIMHVVGIAATFLALGALALVPTAGEGGQAWRKTAAITHGIGMLLLLVGGFGLLARWGVKFPWGGWAWVKIGIWLLLGALPVVLRKKPALGKAIWWLLPLLVVLAGYMAKSRLWS